jgi:acyl dehydratase
LAALRRILRRVAPLRGQDRSERVSAAPPPLVVGPLTRTDFVRYQGASGDMQPLHHDETFARAAGFDAPLAVGMLNAGFLATYVTDWLGPANVRSFRVRFAEQVWPGDTLTCTGTVVREYDADGTPMIDVELTGARQTGGVAVRGWATFVREASS